MGRITVFTVEDCVHCTHLIIALKEYNIPFVEINLTSYPHRRPDMLSLSNRLTVPQVFFNERHVGGADDTFAVLEEWQSNDDNSNKNTSHKTPLEYYQEQVASQPDPTDERLRPPSTDTKHPHPSSSSSLPPRSPSDQIQLPDGTTNASVMTVVETLRRILPCAANTRRRKRRKSKLYKQSFTGAQAVVAFCQEYSVSIPQAVQWGEYLRQSLLLHALVEGHDEDNTNTNNAVQFNASEMSLYRLQCYHTPDVLNSYRIWNTVVDPDCMGLLKRLKAMLDKVEKEVTKNNGGEGNYALVKTNPHFPIFEEAVCELQRVNLTKLDHNTMLAFALNVYNLFIKYGMMKIGVASSSRSRSAFFNGVKFTIGREVYTFNDWEHGVLRGNRKAPYSFKPQFARKDPRLATAMPVVDCRIHFALNCGAKSCPPVRTFTAQGIEEELRIVSQAFCEDDDNIEINVKRRTIYLNKILTWYRVDFVQKEKDLPAKIVEYLRGDKRAKLKQLLEDGKPISIVYKKYDWSTEAGEFEPFDSAVLRADVQRFGPRFQFRSSSSSSSKKRTTITVVSNNTS